MKVNSRIQVHRITASSKVKANRVSVGKRLSQIPRYVLAILLVLIMAIPFIWMVSTSFKPIEETTQLPPKIIPENPVGLDNYFHVIQAIPFWQFLLNSTVVSVTVTVIALFTSALAGYIFAKFQFRGRDTLFFFVVSTMMVPFQVILIPIFLIVRQLGLYDSLWALVIPAVVNAWGIFLMRQGMKTIPGELLDAARIDGASEFYIFLRIVLPIATPHLSALGIFIFMHNWNDFLWPLIVISNVHNRTLPLGLAIFSYGFGMIRWNYVMAATTMTVLPVLILFAALQRNFIEGITLGSIKG